MGWDAVDGWVGGWMVWGLQVSPLSGAETIARAPVAAADCLFKPLISPQVALSPPWSSMTSSGGREGEEEEEGGESRSPSTAKVPERPWQQIANVTAHQPGGGCRAAPQGTRRGDGAVTPWVARGTQGCHPPGGTGVGRAVTLCWVCGRGRGCHPTLARRGQDGSPVAGYGRGQGCHPRR